MAVLDTIYFLSISCIYNAQPNPIIKRVFHKVLLEADLFMTRTIFPFTEANYFTHIKEKMHYSCTTKKKMIAIK